MALNDKFKPLLLPVQARVEQVELTEGEVQSAINAALAKRGLSTAAVLPPVGPNEKPMMLQVVMWMAHAPKPNLNNEGFRPQDLERLVMNGLFQAPYFGMFDENHDFTPKGTIYSAEWAYDAEAKQYGILVKAAVWAWKFPEFVDRLLKQQEQLGFINVSMACVYIDSEEKVWEDGRTYTEIHNPIFLACSAITSGQPGDPAANGFSFMNGDWFDSEYVADMLKASLASGAENTEEAEMKELLEKIESLFGEQKAELQPLVEAVAKLQTVEAELQAAQAAKASVDSAFKDFEAKHEEALAALKSEIESLKSAKAEAETDASTAKAALEAVQATVASLTAENETLATFKKEVEDAKAEVERVKRAEARKAEIPETVLQSLDLENSDEDKALFNEWMEMSDEKWASAKRVLAMASGRKSLAERSEGEGLLSGTTDKAEGDFAINRFKRKK